MIRRLVIAAFMALPASVSASTEVCFTPGKDCTAMLSGELGKAKKEVLIQAYYFTSESLAKAVLSARKRGVRVLVILDRSQKSSKYSSLTFFQNQGIETLIDSSHAIAHNKIMIIDGETVLTGSFNFTKAAQEKNAENLLIIRDRLVVDKYERNFQYHKDHSLKPE